MKNSASTSFLFVHSELEQLRQLVAAARARWAELEVNYTKEKSRVEIAQAILPPDFVGALPEA